MFEVAKVEKGFLVDIILSESMEWVAENKSGLWVDVTEIPGAAIGWLWDGTTATPPPDPDPTYLTVMDYGDFIELIPDRAYRQLKKAAQREDATGEKVDKLLDAIKVSGAVDVTAPRVERLISEMESRSIITAEQAATIRQGVMVG